MTVPAIIPGLPSAPPRAAAVLAVLAWAAVAGPCAAVQTRPSPVVAPNRPDPAPLSPSPRHEVGSTPAPVAKAPTLAPFRLTGLQVEGSTLPPERLRAAYAPYIGRIVDTAAVTEISTRLGAAYAAESGLALYAITVPEQTPVGGVLRVQATEGWIQSVRVDGPAGGGGHKLLRRYATRLTAERPLRKATLERYVSLIRDIPGLNPVLQFAQGTRPGGLALVVVLQPRPVEVGASINNRGTAFLGRTQVELDASLRSLLREGDETRLTVAFPTDLRRFRYYAVSHSTPVGGEGAALQLSLGYLTTKPSFYDLHGHALSAGVLLTAPVVRSYDQNLVVAAGVDGLNSDNALLGQSVSDDRTRAVRVSATYTRQSRRYFLLANAGVGLGVDALGARVLNPAYSDLRFRKVNLRLSANVALPHDTILRLDSTAQYTTDRLPGAEQFALGGEAFGRAFEAAAVTGDRGAAGSAEFAWKLARRLPPWLAGSELYGFADAGRTETVGREGLPHASQTIASAGGGGRVAVGSRAVLQLEVARGLTDPIPTEDHDDWRGVFSIKSLF